MSTGPLKTRLILIVGSVLYPEHITLFKGLCIKPVNRSEKDSIYLIRRVTVHKYQCLVSVWKQRPGSIELCPCSALPTPTTHHAVTPTRCTQTQGGGVF